MNRRAFLLGGVAAVAAVALPAPVTKMAIDWAAGPDKTVSWIVGSDGESNWQWVRATDAQDAIAAFMEENCGVDACEVDASNPPEDCDCEWCGLMCQMGEPERVKRWDDRTYKNPPTPADWLNAGFHFECPCGIGPLELGDGTFICDDGTVECDLCHDKRIRRDGKAAAAFDRGIGPAGAGAMAGMETEKARRHANAPRVAETVPECV